MATSQFFNNYLSVAEQNLLDDLVTESIKVNGIDVYYLPRNILVQSALFREANLTSYNSAYLIEAYIKNLYSFAGDGKFLSKFGLEIRDEITFTISRTAFYTEVANYDNQVRPNEGDLIFLPLNNKLFQIKFVNHEAVFYQMGTLQSYDLVCDLFEFNSETFSTGIADIDNKYNAYSLDSTSNLLLDTSNNILLTTENQALIQSEYRVSDIDLDAMNEYLDTAEDSIIDFSEGNPFGDQGATS